ncbi:MAG TPA: J domain-containing protein [Candidatus Limnocylindria bacterium]|nr:J domain-containing protein [Candidatus Limnocylindria bacterium]
MAPERDPYLILGVARDASLLEIARAHRRLAKAHHPDLGGEPAADERMREVNAAWTLLADPIARAAWDAAHAMPGLPRPLAAWDSTTVPPWRRPDPPPTTQGSGGWLVLAMVIALLVVVLVGGVVAAAMRPDLPGSNSPGYRSNLGD